MLNRFEGDPAEGIVDVETFGHWVKEYRARMLKDPNVRRRMVPVPDDRDDADDFQLVGRESLEIFEIPWDETPLSIKEVIAIQHEAALDQNSEKKVTIYTDEDRLKFEFVSPLVINGELDTVGETQSRQGLTLNFDRKEANGAFNGTWWIDRSLPSSRAVGREVFGKFLKQGGSIPRGDLDRFLSTIRPSEISTTLPQLQDVARLLSKAKTYAVITQLVPENSKP